MKIAVVHPSLAVKGGAENVVIWLADELVRRGHAVTVFTTDYDDAFYGARDQRRFTLHTTDLGGYAYDPIQFFRAGWKLRRVLEGFDCINPHNFPAYVWTALARKANPKLGRIVWFCEEPVRWFYPEVSNRHVLEAARRSQPAREARRSSPVRSALRRLLHWQRNWRWWTARMMDRWAVPRLDLILANSEFIADQVRTIFGVDARACLLGIPQRRFSADGAAGRISPPPAPYMLTVSRLHPEKNIGMVLEAIKILAVRGPLPFTRYVVAGDGPQRRELEQQAADAGIAHLVDFLGFVAERDLAVLYRHAALVIYLPLDETFGLVFPEAGLFRKAVIGPNHGGPSEIIRDGVTGLQVDPSDPEAAAASIERAFTEPHLLERLGDAGYEHAAGELSFSGFVDRFEAELERLLSQGTGRITDTASMRGRG